MSTSRMIYFFTKPLSLLHVVMLVIVVSIFVYASSIWQRGSAVSPVIVAPESSHDAVQARLLKTRTLLSKRLSDDFELQIIPDSSLLAVLTRDNLFFTDEEASALISGDVFVFSDDRSSMGHFISDFLRLELWYTLEKRKLQESGQVSVSSLTQRSDLLTPRAVSRYSDQLDSKLSSSLPSTQSRQEAEYGVASVLELVERQSKAEHQPETPLKASSNPSQVRASSPKSQQAIVKAPTQIPPPSKQPETVQSVASLSEPTASVANNGNPVFGVSSRALQNPLTYIQAEDLAARLLLTTDDLDMKCLQISYAATNYRELYSLFGTLNQQSEKLSKHCGQVYATHALAATGDRLMVVYKAPNERDVITIVSDYTCSYCLKMHKDFERLNAEGITVRVYPYGRAAYSDDSGTPSVLARNYQSLLCRADQAERREILDTLTSNPSFYSRTLIEPNADYSNDACASYISETKIMGDIFVRGATPMVISKDRRSVHGYMDAASVLRWLSGEDRTF
ncbi:hypothetical protein QTV44_002614 [Vibrio vulnificus]|nr:hypothetical protein [Vibrio vulnificus]